MRRTLALAVLPLGLACRAAAPSEARPASAILIDGERVPVDTLVVPWFEEPRYDAYATEGRFGPAEAGLRYRPGRDGRRDGARAGDGRSAHEAVELFVLHYDAVGTSQGCFRVLQDQRLLSVHFLLDVDGTIYQTLDLAETAWHARHANPRSIGIEIANQGAYAPGEAADVLAAWYATEDGETRLRLPEGSGVRAPSVLRPARPAPVPGVVNGRELVQYDFTPEQYEALVRLTVALCRELPGLVPEVPRDASGAVRTDALSEAELAGFRGLVGHAHVSADKVDPGPAFDWERYLAEVRRRLAPAPDA